MWNGPFTPKAWALLWSWMKRSPKAEGQVFLPAACHGAALTFGVVLPKVALRKGYAVMTQADEDGVVTWRENRELAALPRPWWGCSTPGGAGPACARCPPRLVSGCCCTHSPHAPLAALWSRWPPPPLPWRDVRLRSPAPQLLGPPHPNLANHHLHLFANLSRVTCKMAGSLRMLNLFKKCCV